jgi:hypothetical protein
MNRKSGTLSLLSMSGMENILVLKRISTIALGLSALALAVAAILVVMPVVAPGVPSGAAAGVEAASDRWNALGAHYAPDYEGIAAVSSARWSALSEYFSAKSGARTADAARWNVLGARARTMPLTMRASPR